MQASPARAFSAMVHVKTTLSNPSHESQTSLDDPVLSL
jgi:hypothetical protein